MRATDIRPELLKSFVTRVSSVPAGMQPVESWLSYLRTSTGGTGNMVDLEKQWLVSNGATGSTLTDLWQSYLGADGYTPNEDGMRRFFTSGTFTFNPVAGFSWYAAYWAEGTQSTPFVNGNTLTQWDDNSGNNRHLVNGSGSALPVYRSSISALNSRPGVEFTNDWIGLAPASWGTLSQPFTIVVVVNMITPDTSTDNIVAAGDGSLVLFRKANSGANFTSFNASTGITGNTMDTNAHLFSVVHNGASSAIVGDTQTFTGTHGSSGHPGVTLAGLNLAASTVSLNLAFVGFYAGDIRNAAAWPRLKAWASRYGITAI